MRLRKLVKNYCVNVLNREDLTIQDIDDYMDCVYEEIEIYKDYKAVNRIIIKCYIKELKRQIKSMYA